MFLGSAVAIHAQTTLVQTATAGGGTGTGGRTAIFTNPPTAGNLLISIFGSRNAGTITMANAGWSTAINESGAAVPPPNQAIFYKVAVAGQDQSITVNTTATASGNGLHIYEYSGTATTSPLDGTPSSATGTGTAVSSGTPASLTFMDDLLIAGLTNRQGSSFSGATNGFAERNDFTAGGGGGLTIFAGEARTGSNANNTTTATSTASGDWRGQIAAFKSSTPSAVTLDSFTGANYTTGVLLQWQTGYEVDNLGFHLYREQGGQGVRLTPELVAGSALLTGSGIKLEAGQSYSWWDSSPPDKTDVQYWLEEVDLNGQSTWHGPIQMQPSAIGRQPSALEHSQAGLLSMVGRERSQPNRAGPPERHATLSTLRGTAARQAHLASQPAVKLSIRQEGWYRIGQPDLVAAGLDPHVDARLLQLYVDGQPVPMIVRGEEDGTFDAADAIEFYGIGLDTAVTDTRVYWLSVDSKPGPRITPVPIPGGQTIGGSYRYTVQRKDRTTYFGALLNGEQENFFGAVVAKESVDQSLDVHHLDHASPGEALLEVALQGVTLISHQVYVLLNDRDVGEIIFHGKSEGIATFSIPLETLREGSNLITLIAKQGPGNDVSLVDFIQLTYPHTYTADNDALRFTASGGEQVTTGGFSRGDIRVLDVTNADAVQALTGEVQPQDAGFSVTFTAPGTGPRVLLAVSTDQSMPPAGMTANRPSNWRQADHDADLVIITRRELIDSLKPLQAERQRQGLSSVVVDVEDIYDEFSFGQKTPHALKDFLSFATTQWQKQPRFVLLAGDASLDPRNYQDRGDFDLVPTKLIDTRRMETASDDWLADFDGDGVADLPVGRLSARSAEELSIMIAKILGFEQSSASESVLLVADSNRGFDFEAANRQLRTLIPEGVKIQEINRGRTDLQTAKTELLASIAGGLKIVNYIGHGSVNLWAGSLLTNQDARALRNGDQLPLFVTMTCLNGYFHDPALESLSEALLKAPHGGAVAVWASSGIAEPEQQPVMNQELYRLLFDVINGERNALTLGELTVKAKATVRDEDVRRTWILFGDPSMKLN